MAAEDHVGQELLIPAVYGGGSWSCRIHGIEDAKDQGFPGVKLVYVQFVLDEDLVEEFVDEFGVPKEDEP